jgi:hypothetical protein
MVSARVRGIYSTALTRLLLDNSFEIVQPSEFIIERFGLLREEGLNVQPDLEVHDRLDRQGVIVTGEARSVDEFINILKSTLDDAIYRNPLQIGYRMGHRDNMKFALANTLSEEASSAGSDRLVRMNIEFPGLSKKRLDEIRASVTATVEGHHYYKACGNIISSMVDIAEKMLEEGCSKREVEALLDESIRSRFPRFGSKISLNHVKIVGQPLDLGVAKITKFNRKTGRLVLLRRILGKGVYDGLRVKKDPGDFAVTELVIGDLSFRTRYFSMNGEYKGTYINVNTPIELYPAKIRYVDLEVDICVWPSGEVRKIDDEKLEEAASNGLISERLVEISNEETEKILNSINLDEEEEASLLI